MKTTKRLSVIFKTIIIVLLVFNCTICLATNYVVTVAGDNSNAGNGTGTSGTLAYVMQQANNSVGPHKITFQAGISPITMPNPVQLNRAGITIDGFQSADCGPGNRTEIIFSNYNGFQLRANNDTLRGLVISSSIGTSMGIAVELNPGVSGCKIEGCYIGVAQSGTALSAPGRTDLNQGILIKGNSQNNTIGGTTCRERNVIANYNMCVQIEGGTNINNTITGNYIGTDYTGTIVLNPNKKKYGIQIQNNASNNKILNNVIGGFAEYGIFLENGSGNTGTVIKGNFVGIGADSTSKIGNGFYGIFVQQAQNVTIGGPLLSDRNYSGNNGWLPQGIWEAYGHGHGIQLFNGAGNSTIENNWCGVGPHGDPHPNAQDGISLLGSSNNIIKNNTCMYNTFGIFLQGNLNYGAANPPTSYSNTTINNTITGNTLKYNGIVKTYNNFTELPTEGGGIGIQYGSSGNKVGVPGDGNTCDSNLTGIVLRNDYVASFHNNINKAGYNYTPFGAPNNTIYGNIVTNSVKNGIATKFPQLDGVGLVIHGDGSNNNIIGGPGLKSNTIKGNASDGVYIETGVKNWVQPENLISCNVGLGINLSRKPGTTGTVGNEDYGSNSPAGFVTINNANTGHVDASDSTGITNYLYKGYAPANSKIYIYKLDSCTSCANGQGQSLIDSVTTNLSGLWSYSLPKPIGKGIVVYAIEPPPVANRNVSEMSVCYAPLCVPPATAAINVSGGTTVCKGTTVTLKASKNPGYIYVWFDSNGTELKRAKDDSSFVISTSGTYKVRIGDKDNPDQTGCYKESTSPLITIDEPTLPGKIVAHQTICTGTSPDAFTSITPASGGSGTLVYSWESSTDNIIYTPIASTNIAAYDDPNNLTVKTYYRRSVKAGACPATHSDSVIVSIDQLSKSGTVSGPTTSLCTGSQADLSVDNSYLGTIQWQKSTDGNAWENVIGENKVNYSSLNLTSTTYFRVKVTNGQCAPTESAPAVKVTIDDLSIAGSASGSTTACSSGSTELSLPSLVGNIVQWQDSTSGGSWSDIIGANTSPFTTASVNKTTYFRAKVSNGACPQKISGTAIITIDSLSKGGSLSGPNAPVCAGLNNGTLTLDNTFIGSIEKWQRSEDGFITSTDITKTSNSHDFTNLTKTTQFRVVVQSGTCAPANSNSVTITVDKGSDAGTAAKQSLDSCAKGSIILSLINPVGTFEWEMSNDSTAAVWTKIPASQNQSPLKTADFTQTTYFRAIVKNGVCPEIPSTVSTLTISEGSDAGTATAVPPICQNNSGSVSLTGQKGKIQWQQSTDGINGWVNVIGGKGQDSVTYVTPLLNDTMFYKAIVTNGTCASKEAMDTVIVLFASVLSLPKDTFICEETFIKLNTTPSTFKEYKWSTGETTSSIKVTSQGTYTVDAKALNGCPASASIKIDECDAFAHFNVFTPNNDGSNERFVIRGLRKNSPIEIYNRWGKIVYESPDYKNEWDGHDVNDGIYYFIYKRANDKTYTGYVEIVGKID